MLALGLYSIPPAVASTLRPTLPAGGTPARDMTPAGESLIGVAHGPTPTQGFAAVAAPKPSISSAGTHRAVVIASWAMAAVAIVLSALALRNARPAQSNSDPRPSGTPLANTLLSPRPDATPAPRATPPSAQPVAIEASSLFATCQVSGCLIQFGSIEGASPMRIAPVALVGPAAIVIMTAPGHQGRRYHVHFAPGSTVTLHGLLPVGSGLADASKAELVAQLAVTH